MSLYIYLLYYIYHLCFRCIDLYDISAWGGCWFVVYIRRFIYTFLNVCPFDYTPVAGSGKVGPVNHVNHTSWVAVVSPTDRPKSVRNRCVIELFCGVVCVVTLPSWLISVGVGAFVIGFGHISSFLSLLPFHNRCCPLVIPHRYAEPLWKICYKWSVIHCVLLYNMFELVQFCDRKTPTKNRVYWRKIKVTMTHKRSIFASAITLNVSSVKTSYFILKTYKAKESDILIFGQRVKGQPFCDFLIALSFQRISLKLLVHRHFFFLQKWKKMNRRNPET